MRTTGSSYYQHSRGLGSLSVSSAFLTTILVFGVLTWKDAFFFSFFWHLLDFDMPAWSYKHPPCEAVSLLLWHGIIDVCFINCI